MYTAKLSNTCIKDFSLPSNLIYEFDVEIRFFVFSRHFQRAGVYLADTVAFKTDRNAAAVFGILQIYETFFFILFLPYRLRQQTGDTVKNAVGNAETAVRINGVFFQDKRIGGSVLQLG